MLRTVSELVGSVCENISVLDPELCMPTYVTVGTGSSTYGLVLTVPTLTKLYYDR